jgi:hypothetical protein
MFGDVIFYFMVSLIPSMIVLALLLRRNPFEEKETAENEKNER